ncbi:MAG TPA: DUF916 domain-containing protein [Thermomicrobiales bacterium]|nr:DUF916 domain-containing protein [Thermomicrobiales bacterium]
MTNSRRHVLLIWFVTVLFALSLVPSPSLAQESTPESTPAAPEPPSFLIAPVGDDQDGSYFTVTMEPGSTQELTVALGSGGDEPVTALAYAADAYTLVNGGFGVRTADDEQTGPTTWIDFPTETLDLNPGDRVERTFTVSVPKDTPPGQYLSALAIQTADSIAVGDSTMFRQIIKKSIAVFIIVPGPETPALEIGEASVKQTETSNSLVVELSNPGNVFLNPEGTVTMTTADGKPVLTSPIAMGPVYAGMGTTLELYIPTMLAPGDYTVSVSLRDEKRDVSEEAESLPVTVTQLASATPAVQPVTFTTAEVDPITSGSGELQAVNVLVTLDNPEATIPNAKLTLHVMRNGELVEDYPLNSALVVQQGTTDIQQRYIPLGSWDPGDYTFSLTLEAVDPGTGQLTVLATQDIDATITVP